MLVGAMNPCPCGYYGDSHQACTCSASMVTRYQKRVSGPLLDRIDIFVDVPRIDYEKLVASPSEETSADVRGRVEQARAMQRERFNGVGNGVLTNADMGPEEVWKFCQVDDSAKGLLQSAMQQLGLSARGFHRILKLARTIADLADSQEMDTVHLAEALQYRQRGQGM